MTFSEQVIDELRAMQDIGAISIRTLSRAVRMVRDNDDIFGSDYGCDGRRDSVMSVTDAADMALALAEAR